MARVLFGLTVVALAVSGCAVGRNAVDQGASGRSRYVGGDGALKVYPSAARPAAPRLRGELLDGSPFDSKVWAGDVIVVNFWGSWCPPCRAEAGDLQAVYERTKASGVQFLGVDVKDERSAAQAFQRTKKVTYPSLFDPAGRVTLTFRDTPPNAIPSTLVIDRSGRIVALFRGSLVAAALRPVVERAARGSA